MQPKTILFADNATAFLDVRASFIAERDYKVVKAHSLEQAIDLLTNNWVHLAIFDVRMVDDTDKEDMSGLRLAEDGRFRVIPKIILTIRDDSQVATASLRAGPDGVAPAVDFCNKMEGPEVLLAAIERAFETHVRINSNLAINWNGRDNLYLVNAIQPGLTSSSERLVGAAGELEDLFRKLFYDREQITIERVIWQREGRMALSVVAFKNGETPQARLVVCGKREVVADEARRYSECAPKTPGETATILLDQAETTHFAAICYALSDTDLEGLTTLSDLYRASAERSFNTALVNLANKNLRAWSGDKRISDPNQTLDAAYRPRVGLNSPTLTQEMFGARLHNLVQKLPEIGLDVKIQDERLIFQFGRKSYNYANPTPLLFRTFGIEQPLLLNVTPGVLAGDSILVDEEKRVWLTDLSQAGNAPLFWNFIQLEALVRFDWLETNKFQQLHEAEQSLLDLAGFNRLQTQVLEVPISRALRAILEIRKLVTSVLNQEPLAYQLGLLFIVGGAIARIPVEARQTPREQIRLAHLVMAAAMLADTVVKATASTPPPETSTVLTLDKIKREVCIGERLIDLTKTEFEMIEILYNRAGQLCKRGEFYELLFKNSFDNTLDQNNHLNTNVGRLRRKIEPDQEHMRYLVTYPGEGYKLITDPDSSQK